MTTLFIEGTEDTPEINFDGNTLQFTISGRSLPEDVTSFYQPVTSWLDVFELNENQKGCFHFKLEYFNTASSKVILDILMKIEEIVNDKQSNLSVKWHHQESDEDMLEAGEEYKELVSVPFEIVSY
jgi:hypothetical protein